MDYVLYAFSAFCLVNGIPHFVQGVCGHRFQSPFAKPPGIGESSPLTNVLWGSFNFFLSFVTLSFAGFFTIGSNTESYVFVGSAFLSSVLLATVFGKIRTPPAD